MDTTPRLNDPDNTLLRKICQLLNGGVASGVLSFNARTGAVTLSSADVTTALGFTPVSATVTVPFTAKTITSTTGNFVITTDDSATTFAYQEVFKKRGTTGDATAAVTLNSELGGVSWQAWNGSGYVTNAQLIARAAQNQSVGNAGGLLQLSTTPNGTTSPLVRAIISAQGNLLLSNATTVEPASMIGGIVWKNATAASGDPVGAGAMWFNTAGSGIAYRTDIANEGSGQNNLLHNRAAQQAGVGTNYTLTNATAQVNFGTTNATVTLPTIGRYLVQANVSIIDGAGADDIYHAKLRNTTAGADLGVDKKVSGGTSSGRRFNIFLSQIVDVAVANTVVQIFAFNESAARGTIESTTTDMLYVRLS